jgi:hypothetical protein
MEPTTIDGKRYYWASYVTKKHVDAWVRLWEEFCFRHNGKDYFVVRSGKGYIIRNPRIDAEGTLGAYDAADEYPMSREAKTPEEFVSLPFIDGKTIFEEFDRLSFFNAYHEKIVDNDMKPKVLKEFIESGQPFYFTFRGQDYLVEGFSDRGNVEFIIVEPKLYSSEGGWPEKTDAAYPGHLEAKSPKELMSLPFLDGKTIFERFDELQFFDM